MTDRRQLQRKHLVLYPKVTEVSSGKTLGRIGDISNNGLLLISDKEIPVHMNFDVNIELPKEEGANLSTTVRAVIQTDWTEPDANPNLVCVGSHFVDLSPSGKASIEDAIIYYGFRS